MLTKREIAELIIIQKTGGNPSVTSPIDPRDVYAVVNMVAAELIAQEAGRQLDKKNQFDLDSTWVRQYNNVVIQYDKTVEQTYIDLPASRVSLYRDMDIRYVGWQAGGVAWPQESQGSQQAWSMLEAGASQPNQYPYYPVGDRLYFRTMPKRLKGKKVMVRMVAGIDGYDETEMLPIPDGFAGMLLERVANMFQVQISTKAKNINDSNSNVRV